MGYHCKNGNGEMYIYFINLSITTHPPYLYDLVSIQPPHGHNTRSSHYVTLIKPSSSLIVTHRSFRHASPHLWNQLPTSLRIPHPHTHPPLRDLYLNMPV